MMTLSDAKLFAERVKKMIPPDQREPAFEALVVLHDALGDKYSQTLDEMSKDFAKEDYEC